MGLDIRSDQSRHSEHSSCSRRFHLKYPKDLPV